MTRILNDDDLKIIREFYDKKMAAESSEARQVGWRDRETQDLRSRILSEIGRMDNRTVLDVGCGLCGFYEYLVKQNIQCRYTGFEIVDSMLEQASKKFPQLSLHHKDLLTDTGTTTFDYVIMGGILSLKLTENEEYTRTMFQKALSRCNIGVAANLMGTYVDYHDDYLYYADPAEIFRMGKKLTPRVVIRYDYMPYEFIIYLYKDDFPGHLY